MALLQFLLETREWNSGFSNISKSGVCDNSIALNIIFNSLLKYGGSGSPDNVE